MTKQPVGERLRAARQRKGLSLRELASRVGVSASLLSQLENGKSQASVRNLHALVTALDISLDQLFDSPGGAVSAGADASGTGRARGGQGPVLGEGERPIIEMASGVTWERLSSSLGRLVDFQLVTYEPGSASSSDGRLTRHNGSELAYIIEGELTLVLGFDEYQLSAGDSLSFDSTTPHLYTNRSSSRARGIWFEVGRRLEHDLEPTWPGPTGERPATSTP